MEHPKKVITPLTESQQSRLLIYDGCHTEGPKEMREYFQELKESTPKNRINFQENSPILLPLGCGLFP